MDTARKTLRSETLRQRRGDGVPLAPTPPRSSVDVPLGGEADVEAPRPSPLAPTYSEAEVLSNGVAGGGANGVAEGEPRAGRALWGSARDRLGLVRVSAQEDGAAPTVMNTGQGAMPAREPATANALLNIFAAHVAAGLGNVGGLGTGQVLASTSSGERPGWISPKTDSRAILRLFTSSWANLLLLCIPVGYVLGGIDANPNAVFVLNFLSLLPLALILGEVTEDLAIRFGDAIGGLLNATFGNVVELILAIAALLKGLYTVVAASLIGSILSNLLLVLGMCFFCGGIKYSQQRFSTLANKVAASLLFMSCIALIIPSTAGLIYGAEVVTPSVITKLSHAISIVLILLYGGYLLFQLKTHRDLFTGEESEEEPALSLVAAVGTLLGITVLVAVCSEFLTGAIEAVSESWGVNQAFLGLIVLPIAGNAAEHITAVFVAMKDKMDLAIGVALGSSIQIALFVIPVVVLVGWIAGKTFLLNFDAFTVLILTVSVILAYFVSSDGYSNWLLGLQLVATYILIACVFLLEKEPPAYATSDAEPQP